MQGLWIAPEGSPSSFPCVDCGLLTGNFCDGEPVAVGYDRCFAANRVPEDYSFVGKGSQRTPLCSYCETLFDYCRFCRGVMSCTPPTLMSHWSNVPQSQSRHFDQARAKQAERAEWAMRDLEKEEARKLEAHLNEDVVIDALKKKEKRKVHAKEDHVEEVQEIPNDLDSDQQAKLGFMFGEYSVVHGYQRTVSKLKGFHTYNFVRQMMGLPSLDE